MTTETTTSASGTVATSHSPALEERLSALFEPDVLLPSQYQDRLRRRADYEGERRLMIAILEDAVDVYRKCARSSERRKQNLFRDAEAWIESDDQTWVFSYTSICDALGLDASCLRHGLRAFKRGDHDGAKRMAVMGIRPADAPELMRVANGS